MRRQIVCEHLHQPAGWRSPGTLVIDGGRIVEVLDVPDDRAVAETIAGFVIPGLPNLHSHAFQRAMAGCAENVEPGQSDDFWTWRARMYALALAVTPDDVEAIAAQLYVEMLEAGMTAVGEFHYLHHDFDGAPYANPAELGLRIAAAAHATGIALVHLPVLYMSGGFAEPARDEQRRFIHRDVDAFLRTVEPLRADSAVGVALHSLRAVPAAAITDVLSAFEAGPVHIHIAEQTKEVDDCIAFYGARPVQWLLQNADVGPRWCLVHATHIDADERRALAASGAVAGLCPTTEANLGDGFFDALGYIADGGTWGVGSDSHVTISAAEELRLLEYGQRLRHERRNVLAGEHRHVGRALYDSAVSGGAQALLLDAGVLQPGCRADLVVLDANHPRLVGHPPDSVLDAWIFGSAERAVRDVMVGGEWFVQDGLHRDRDPVATRYAATVRRLIRA